MEQTNDDTYIPQTKYYSFCKTCTQGVPSAEKTIHRCEPDHVQKLRANALRLKRIYQREPDYDNYMTFRAEENKETVDAEPPVQSPPDCIIDGSIALEGYESPIVQVNGHSWKIGIEFTDRGAEVYLECSDNQDKPFHLDFDISIELRSSSMNKTLVKEIKHVLMNPNKSWVSLFSCVPLEVDDKFSLSFRMKQNYYRVYEPEKEDERPPKSRRGRPTEYQRFKTLTTKLLNCWFHNNRNKPLGERMFQQLLDVVAHFGFTERDAARTVNIALKCDEFILDCMELREYKFKGTDEVISYYSPEDIVKYVLNNRTLTQGWVNGSSPSLTIEHPAHSEAWKKCEEHFESEITNSNARLVLPVLWIDGFVGELTRKKTYCAFSLTFANFSNELMSKHKSRFGIANLPPNLVDRKNEFIEDVLIPFFEDLETRKLMVTIGQTNTPLVGRLFTIKGDHIAKIELAGVTGTNGLHGAFYTTTNQNDYAHVDKVREWRDPKKSFEIIARLQTLDEAGQAQLKKSSGLCVEKSPFWELPFFAEDFYKNFSSCGLHLLSLGIIKRVAKCIGIKLGAEYRMLASEQIPNIHPPSNFDTISMSVHQSAGKSASSLSGGMWRTYAAASIVFNKAHLSRDDFIDWKSMMNDLLSVFRSTYTKEELQPGGTLEKKIKSIQKTMMKLFPIKDGFRYKFPNFESLIALPQQIIFLGPLHFQSTEREEEMNRRRRQVLQCANRVNPSTHITKVIERERAAGEVTFEDEDGNNTTFNDLFSRKNIIIKPDYTTFGHGKHNKVSKYDRPRIVELFAQEYGVERNKITPNYAYNVEGFYWNNKKAFSGASEGLILDFENQTIAGIVDALFMVNATIRGAQKRTKDLLLCALRPIELIDRHGSVREGTLKEASALEFYPLGWGRHVVSKVARVIKASPSSRDVFVWS